MKKLPVLAVFLLLCQALLADLPGNQPRRASTLSLKGVSSLKGWTLYVVNEADGDEPRKVTRDTAVQIPGGRGRPYRAEIFAQNAAGKETKRIPYGNRGGEAITVYVTGVTGDANLQVSSSAALQPEPAQAPAAPATAPVTDSLAPPHDPQQAAVASPETPADSWLLVASAGGLLVLLGALVRRKRKEKGNGE